MRMVGWILVCGAVLAVFGCEQRRIVHVAQQSVTTTYWTWADSLTFGFDVADTSHVYNLWMQIRHTDDYPYQNLYTRLHTTFPDGRRLSQQVNFELADGTGSWLGKKKRGHYMLELPIQERAYFDKPGSYKIVVEQLTRTDTLRGISGWQFSLEDIGPKPVKK
jgi:gliding motility-associated lipoprotein GldH